MIDQLPITTSAKLANSTTHIVAGRVLVDGFLFPSTENLRLEFVAKGVQIGGGKGYALFYDYDKAEEIGRLEFTSADPVRKRGDLKITNCPADIELQIFTDGTGEFTLLAASVILMVV